MAEPPARGSLPIEGEDLQTPYWTDARHWISIYGDLLHFKRGLLSRIRTDLAKLSPPAQAAAAQDVTFVANQMEGYQKRLDLWYQRVWELQGLWVDPESRIVRHQGREAALTNREFQLLQFLLDHPHRYFTAVQILSRAWADPDLFPEQVRNYIRRLRRILVALEIPCDLVNRPGHGYSLIVRS
ncbi:MAG TPA: winged helix-turn-helix domain-containing protein [Candidatus Dormibacteraeota bacterium]|jgi:DNA-binding response OmpR family regulator|nr:winged helix-turn-helix domain-containing protein [Candidatus Dormibacteraeota bacterium]